MEAFAPLDLVLLNDPASNTFDNGRYISFIDLTFVSGCIARNTSWVVADAYTNSDHLAIIFETKDARTTKRSLQGRKG